MHLPQHIPLQQQDALQRPLLVYLSGTDGTGQAIQRHVPGLEAAGYDVRCVGAVWQASPVVGVRHADGMFDCAQVPLQHA